MNTQTVNTNTTRLVLVAAVALVMLLFFAITPTLGQKEQAERAITREGLTETGFMTNPEVSDDIDGTEDEYFYKFQARPGKLTVTVEVTANETNAGAMLDLFGPNSKAILSNILVQAADGGSEKVTKSVNLAKAQDIIIRIKGLKYGSSGGYPGIYKIRLEGTAVKFTDGVQPDGVVQDKKPDEASTDTTDPNIKPDVPQSDPAGQGNPAAAQSEGTGQDKKAAAPSDVTGQNKKPDAVDRAIEKGKAKSKKVLNVLDKVKAKIPD